MLLEGAAQPAFAMAGRVSASCFGTLRTVTSQSAQIGRPGERGW